MKSIITRTILLLSFVSLFTDVSSEMLYPVMPLFLQSIGFTAVWIGLLEGFAEAIAGLSKMYFGRVSDAMHYRMPLVRWGYLLSALSKPMMAAFTFPAWIFSARTLDRFGKGLRTGARDALLSDESKAVNKAAVFGFHRAMDTVGAVLGPLLALLFLSLYPNDYRSLFLLAFIPALLSAGLTWFIKEQRRTPDHKAGASLTEKFLYWKQSTEGFRKVMPALLLFGLVNSSDIFLLLMAKEVSGSDSLVIAAYIGYNLVFALLAYPMGRLADRIGLKRMLAAGIFLFALVYMGLSGANQTEGIIALLILYGWYAACTDGISKALISNLVPKSQTGSAIGFYTGWNSICALAASSITGFIWHYHSPSLALLVSGVVALAVAGYLFWLPLQNNHFRD